jgi:Ribosomal protein L23
MLDKLNKIIISPLVTEKGSAAQMIGKYVFKVIPKATKSEIKAAVSKMFAVEVIAVRVLRMKGKNCSFKQIKGKHRDWKKAYVTIKNAQAIDFGNIGL